MTAYANFIDDFPKRCLEILDRFSRQSKLMGRDVTLSLMVASSGFVTPFERLKKSGQISHPSEDRAAFQSHADALEQLMEQNFIGSDLMPEGSDFKCLRAGNLKSISGAPDTWPELKQDKKMLPEKKVKNVLKQIRNALAHGNVYTTGTKIREIIFIGLDTTEKGSETIIKKFTFIAMSPEAFLIFLRNWFEFLITENISQFEASEVLDGAA